MSDWNPARLIPVSGIGNSDEQEGRATSALLAVMHIVKDFGRTVVHPLGAPAGQLLTFTEPIFPLGEKNVRPDGLLQTSRASKTWTALVEVKTGSNELEAQQVEAYLDVARENGFDVVLTISNQISLPGTHPVAVDKRKLRKVALHHVSWVEILGHAVNHHSHRGVTDPEQQYILSELIRYLNHPRSGILQFNDMGPHWVSVREDVCARTARPTTKPVLDIVDRFEQLGRFVCLQLEQRLGRSVSIVVPRSMADPLQRRAASAAILATDGRLAFTVRVPGAVSTISAVADLRAGTLEIRSTISGPLEGRPQTRVRWLLRQLSEAPGGVRVQALTSFARTETTAMRLDQALASPEKLLPEAKHEIKRFDVWQDFPLGTKRASGRGGFITSVVAGIESYYDEVLQPLRAWTPAGPRGKDVPTAASSVAEDQHGDLPELPDEAAPISDVTESDILGQDDYAPEPGERPEDVVADPIERGSEPLPADSRLLIEILGTGNLAGAREVDVIALLLGDDGLVSGDHDLVFFGQAVHPSGAVALHESSDGQTQLVVDVAALPTQIKQVWISAQVTEHAPGSMGTGVLEVLDLESERIVARSALPASEALGSATLMDLLRLVRQDDEWTLEVQVEPSDTSFPELALSVGIAVDD